LLTDFPVKM